MVIITNDRYPPAGRRRGAGPSPSPTRSHHRRPGRASDGPARGAATGTGTCSGTASHGATATGNGMNLSSLTGRL